MVMFCPTCGNLLGVEDGKLCKQFSCRTCPYVFMIQRKVSNKFNSHSLKEVDDILGGAAAWENADCTDATCPKCDNRRAYYYQVQTRSADEPMSTFYRCENNFCCYQWKE